MNEYAAEEIRSDFAELAVHSFMAGGSDIHGILSIADQRTFVMVEVADVEEVALRGGALIHEEPWEILEPDEVVENEDKNCNLEGITMTEEIETSALRGKKRELQEKYCFTSIYVSSDMFAVVWIAERSLHLERQVTEQKKSVGCGRMETRICEQHSVVGST